MNSQRQQIEEETDFILNKFMEGYKLVEIYSDVKNYLESKFQQAFLFVINKDYKSTYYIYKKIEKILMKSLRYFNSEPEKLPEFSNIMLYILDSEQIVSSNEKLTILKLPPNVQNYSKFDGQDSYYYILKYLIQTLNNIGVILMMRNKKQQAVSYLMRTLAARSYILESHVSLFQMGTLLQNMGFIYQNENQFEDAKQFTTKAILIYESLNSPETENYDISINYKFMFNFIEIFFSQTNPELINQPREIQKERMIHLLAISYNYFSQIFESLKEFDSTQFCINQFEFFCELMQQINPKIKKHQKYTQEQIINYSDTNKKQDNINITQHKINKFFNKQDSQPIKQEQQINNESIEQFKDIPQDQILLINYVSIQDQRFKIILLKPKNYFKIILYSEPLNILKSILIMYTDLIEYQKNTFPQAFDNEKNEKQFFLSLIKNLYLCQDQLHIREVKYYHKIEEIKQMLEQ